MGRNVFLPGVAAIAVLAVARPVAAADGTDLATTNAVPSSSAPADADGRVPPDSEIWNRGVELWRTGDLTNALETVRPLVLSRTHGARAAELAAAIEHGMGRFEDAARDAQLALRASPDDARANRNFTRATDGLAEKRERRRVEEVLRRSRGRGPDELIGGARATLRELLAGAATVLTNAPARAIAESERMAKAAETAADAWLAAKEAIARSVTNEQQAATIAADMDTARARTEAAARRLDDLDPDAVADLAHAETALNRYYKLVVLPPSAADEAALAQTNAFADAERVNGRDWQRESLDYVRAFRRQFPAYARQVESDYRRKVQQGDTNAVPFTKEAQDEISALSAEVEKLQLSLVENPLPPKQQEACVKLARIRELLPKDPNGGNQDKPKGRPQANPQDGRTPPDRSPDEPRDDPQDGERENPPDGDEPKDKDGGESGDKPPADDEVEAVLRKAQERADEHENEKRSRMRTRALAPNERDW